MAQGARLLHDKIHVVDTNWLNKLVETNHNSQVVYLEHVFLCYPSTAVIIIVSPFFNRTVRDWNILPQDVIQLGTVCGLEALKKCHIYYNL